MKRFIISLIVLLLTIAPASAIIVHDPKHEAATRQQTIKQLEQMIKEYKTLQAQLKAVTGGRGYGSLLNGLLDKDWRRFAPSSWEDYLKILESGGSPGRVEDVSRVMKRTKEQYAPLAGNEVQEILNDKSGKIAEAYDAETAAATGGIALAEKSYDRVEESIERLEKLMQEVDQTEDIKASTDLGNRVNGEVGLLMAEQLRLSAALLRLKSQEEMRRKMTERYTAEFFGGREESK